MPYLDTGSAAHTVREQPVLTGLASEYADTRPSRNQMFAEDRPIHDWYRFVLSFPPHIVREYLARFGLEQGHVVLDPFCGTGTTMVEAKKLGVASVGIEAVPLSAFAATTKLDWTPTAQALMTDAQRIASASCAQLEAGNRETLRTLPPTQTKLLLKNSISAKPLHRALILRDAIRALAGDRADHHLLALARQLPTEIGNLRFGPEIGVGAIKEDAPVIDLWEKQLRRMCSDLDRWRPYAETPATIVRGDARLPDQLLAPASIDAVITSPPYPNEKDYTRTVRLESVLLGFLTDRESLQRTKRDLVRSNSRSVYKEDEDDAWIEQFPNVIALAEEIEHRRIDLGKTSGFERMYHRVTRLYFGGMARHLESLKRVLKPGAQLAYVVGDQASYFRIMIRTGEILGQIADSLGYDVIGRDLFRTRAATATRSKINEEVLVLRWPG